MTFDPRPVPLMLFNSMGRELQEFTPHKPPRVSLYTCGLTVYNYAHVGNLRAYVFTDTLRRVLQLKGYDVLHVMNITDVGHLTSDADEGNDKMELAASREGKTIWEIAAHYTAHFLADLADLRVMPATVLPRATDHIQEMIEFAKLCEDRGYTYRLEDGLYFDTLRLPDYGRLALMDREAQKEARIAPIGAKHTPHDFAVWRSSPPGSKRLMEWSSPWGDGAPGWHLECSVMSLKYLSEQIDIHTGGVDHREIHHVNEIAQNQAYLGGNTGVRYWLHNEFLLLGDEKMSKSSGKFVRLASLRDAGIHPLVYRYFLLAAHYRSKLTFSFDALVGARSALLGLFRDIARIREKSSSFEPIRELVAEAKFSRGGSFRYLVERLSRDLDTGAQAWLAQLNESVARDLNTAAVVSQLLQIASDKALAPDQQLALFGIYDLVLGLGLLEQSESDLLLRPAASALSEPDIARLLAERSDARGARDYARADAIRTQLEAEGVLISDRGTTTHWEWMPLLPKPQ